MDKNSLHVAIFSAFIGRQYEEIMGFVVDSFKRMDKETLEYAANSKTFMLPDSILIRNETIMISPLLWLINNDKSVDYRLFYRNMKQIKDEDIISTLFEKRVNGNKKAFFNFLLDRGLNVNKKINKWTPLASALSFDDDNYRGWSKILLDLEGIDVNVLSQNNTTPLGIVVSNSSPGNRYQRGEDDILMFKKLLKMGANPNIQEKGNKHTILHDMVMFEVPLEMYSIAIKHGANPNIANKWGDLPLYYALLYLQEYQPKHVRLYYEQVVDYLIPLTDLTVKNKKGEDGRFLLSKPRR